MPLHCLCYNNKLDETASIRILKLLIEKYPEAVRRAAGHGCLPIHLAAMTTSPKFCQLLIEAYPESERIVDAHGTMPLHLACTNNTVDTVQYLYKLYPDAINHLTTLGNFPIHCAISSIERSDNPAVAVEIVKFLLDCDPDVKDQKRRGESLLHCACQLKCNDSNIEAALRIIQVIYDEYPESIRIEDSGGQLPLHYCCGGDAYESGALKTLKLLIEKYPEGVRHADRQGRLPIHYAAGSRSPEFCRVLIEAYPGSEQISSLGGALPLHFACRYNTVATVKCLHKLYPDAVNLIGTNGHYPIHFAITGVNATSLSTTRNKSNGALDIVQYLLDCDPNVKFQDYRGESLLHFTCLLTSRQKFNDSNINTALEIIKTLYDAHPEAIEDEVFARIIRHYHVQVQAFINSELRYARQAKDHRLMMTPDDNGRLPLHAALQDNVRLGSIKLLVKGNPSAIRSFDERGVIPLHVACEHHDSASVVGYMISLSGITLDTTDRQGNTALHYACRGAKYDTVALLLDKFDAVSVSKRNVDGKLPIDLLWESNADRESQEYTENVYRLLRAYPETTMLIGLRCNLHSFVSESDWIEENVGPS